MFENDNDVDELYVSPESHHVQFQPTRIIPKPTGTENELVQQTESALIMAIADRNAHTRHLPSTSLMTSLVSLQLDTNCSRMLQCTPCPTSALEAPNLRLQSYMQAAFQAETVQALPDDINAFSANDFEPVPSHWKHIMSLAEDLKLHWIASLRKELLTLLRMQTFDKDFTMTLDDMIIAVTAKFRTRLTSTGAIDKLKARICLCCDVQTKGHWDTWCLIAGFRALRIFLAIGARQKCRIFQLDFVGAFL